MSIYVIEHVKTLNILLICIVWIINNTCLFVLSSEIVKLSVDIYSDSIHILFIVSFKNIIFPPPLSCQFYWNLVFRAAVFVQSWAGTWSFLHWGSRKSQTEWQFV